MSGFMLVVLGLWGGLIPFVGPYFGYAFGSHATWHLTTDRLWLDVLPGAAVLLGGLMVLGATHRASGTLGSWLAMAGGAWFAVGPAVSRLWEHAGGPIGVPLFGHTRQTLELVGYFYGLGALVVGLAAFALGRVVTRPALALVPPAAQNAAAQNAADQNAAAQPAMTEPATAEPVMSGSAPAQREHAAAGSVS